MMTVISRVPSVAWFALLLLCTGCGSESDGKPSSSPVDAGHDARPDTLDATDEQDMPPEAGSDVEAGPDVPEGPFVFTIYSTSDEHGWVQPWTSGGNVYGGVANVFASMKGNGFDAGRDLLVSSGDNWTGAAVTTVFEGEPMVEVFNYMGYAASALGNHEFDFGVPVLEQRISEASYAYVGANLYHKGTTDPVDFAAPYVIVQRQGIDVALVGVTTPDTATSTHPKNVEAIDFAPVVETLDAVIPEVRSEGAELVIVLAHEYFSRIKSIAPQLTNPPDAIFTGHDHLNMHEVVAGIPVIGSGVNMKGYTVTRFEVDPDAASATFLDARFEYVSYPETSFNPLTPDPGLSDIVDGWQGQLDVLLGEEIGYTESGITVGWMMGNWVTDSWLWAYPDADVAMTNFGGLRVAIPSGPIEIASVFDVMPFENTIYELELTGQQLRDDIALSTTQCGYFGGCSLAIAGIRFTGVGLNTVVTLPDGTPIDPTATYRVLVNDYMYEAGPYPLKAQDPTPVDLGLNYRDPVVDWTQQLGTSPADPIEAYIDSVPRNQ